jgi:hypothetical protein
MGALSKRFQDDLRAFMNLSSNGAGSRIKAILQGGSLFRGQTNPSVPFFNLLDWTSRASRAIHNFRKGG